MVLQADQLEAPAPGTRGIVLSKKPAAELKLSKQKLVQGMIEFSLETPRTAAAAEAASEGAAAAPGAEAGGGVTPVGTKELGSSEEQMSGRAQASKVENQGGGVTPVDTKELSSSEEHMSGRAQTSKVENRQARTRKKSEEGGDGQGVGAEWEGVTWDEGETPEAESLGSVSASLTGAGSASLGTTCSITLGTVELASRRGHSTGPQDVLLCLKEVAGIREVTKQKHV